MKIEKVKSFTHLVDEYFKKKYELSKMFIDIQHIVDDANVELNAIINNGFTSKYIDKIWNEYKKHKFNSSIVNNFLVQVDDMFFSNLEPELKKNLEVSSIDVCFFTNTTSCNECTSYGSVNMYSSVELAFIDNGNDRKFTLKIPIKGGVCTNISDWKTYKNGLYVVEAVHHMIEREICCVFDKRKVVEAVRKYLKGEFDSEFVIFNKNNEYDVCYDEYDQIDDIYYATVENMFNTNMKKRHKFYGNEINSCVDDRNDYENVDLKA